MIELPELCIVLAVFALMGGYIFIVHRLMGNADDVSKPDSASLKRAK
jgi:hypothetical protein